jgi:membrane protein
VLWNPRLVSLYGLFASPSAISDQLLLLAGILPRGAVDILREQIGRVTAGSGAKLGFGFIFGLAVALWSANAGMKAIMDALNVVYEEKEKRGFIKLNVFSLAFTIAPIASLLFALGAVVVIPVALSYLGLQNVTELLFRLGRWPLLLLVVIFGLAVLYRYGPSRREPRWQWISVGSAFAAIAWLISSALLSWYLASFANYNATYGSLGAGVGMMMWMWISAIVILFGAQLNSEIEHQTARDSTVHGEKPSSRTSQTRCRSRNQPVVKASIQGGGSSAGRLFYLEFPLLRGKRRLGEHSVYKPLSSLWRGLYHISSVA